MTTRTPKDDKRKGRRPAGWDPESDLAVWQQVTRGVTPLPGRAQRIVESPPDRSHQPIPVAPAVVQPPPPADRNPSPPAALRHGEGAGIDRRTHDRFRRGRMAIEARLDLHGMTREHAHHALNAFVRRAHDRGFRCVLVVTGKGAGRDGGGVLRREVPVWLNQATLRPLVLGISHAQRRDGGEGALYVLLKRRREAGP